VVVTSKFFVCVCVLMSTDYLSAIEQSIYLEFVTLDFREIKAVFKRRVKQVQFCVKFKKRMELNPVRRFVEEKKTFEERYRCRSLYQLRCFVRFFFPTDVCLRREFPLGRFPRYFRRQH